MPRGDLGDHLVDVLSDIISLGVPYKVEYTGTDDWLTLEAILGGRLP
jgi:hypothetical protein